MVRMPPDELTLLDQFIAERAANMSRPEALRSAFRQLTSLDLRIMDPSLGSGGFLALATAWLEREQNIAAAIDKFAADQSPPLSRPEAIRLLITEQLTALGLLPHREDPEGAN